MNKDIKDGSYTASAIKIRKKLGKKIINFLFVPITVLFVFCGCGKAAEVSEAPTDITGLTFAERVENVYAERFVIDRYEGGYSLISTMDGEKFLIVPEGKGVPEGLDENIVILRQPIENIYLAASSAMGLFDGLESGSLIKFSGTKAEDWYIDSAANAMKNGEMLYAGKYRDPDYELLLTNGCGLAVESSMIGHSPEVKDKLTELGIPVFVDYSSYEPHPLGRSEWIKVYGEMCGKPEKASELLDRQSEMLKGIESAASTGKTAVFFYINTEGQAVTRGSEDYITKMIELAGGENIFAELGDPDTVSSSVTMETEQFYEQAKNADFIIYNSTVDGEVTTLDELVSKNELLADFKAVKDGNVWCARENLYQETMKLGTFISDLNYIFTDNTEKVSSVFLFKLESGETGE